MDDIKTLLIKKHEQIDGYEHYVDDYQPRIRRMLSDICRGLFTQEQIVDTHDSSIFSNGSEGIVFTTEAICVKDSANSTKRFIAHFKDIKSCEMIRDRFLGVDISRLLLHMKNGQTYKLSTTLGSFNLDDMQELIEYAMSLYSPVNQKNKVKTEKPEKPEPKQQKPPLSMAEIADLEPEQKIAAANIQIKERINAILSNESEGKDEDESEPDYDHEEYDEEYDEGYDEEYEDEHEYDVDDYDEDPIDTIVENFRDFFGRFRF